MLEVTAELRIGIRIRICKVNPRTSILKSILPSEGEHARVSTAQLTANVVAGIFNIVASSMPSLSFFVE